MGIPQLIMIFLLVTSLARSFYRHGTKRVEVVDFNIDALAATIMVALLIWGGFF